MLLTKTEPVKSNPQLEILLRQVIKQVATDSDTIQQVIPTDSIVDTDVSAAIPEGPASDPIVEVA